MKDLIGIYFKSLHYYWHRWGRVLELFAFFHCLSMAMLCFFAGTAQTRTPTGWSDFESSLLVSFHLFMFFD